MCGRTNTRIQYNPTSFLPRAARGRMKEGIKMEPEMEIVNTKSDEAASDIDLAYCRAAIYSAMVLGFQPPTDETLSRLLARDSKSSLVHAASMLYPDREPNLICKIEALPDAEEADRSSLASRYRLFFGHTARGQIPPYETEYGNEALFQQPQELGDLMGFYRAFGLALKSGTHERPDHVSCECEFLMFLALKEAYAQEQDNREMLAETRKAEKLFLRDHLGRFLPTFVTQLTREDPSGFYSTLGELCLRFVAAECARLHVTLGLANLGLRPADDSRVPMACGSETECGAMPGACMPEGDTAL
jgi:DMSO reductase family type II enzyme chaperone